MRGENPIAGRYVLMWIHVNRDAVNSLRWTGGEARARRRFALLLASIGRPGAPRSLAECMWQALDLVSTPPSTAWTDQEWHEFWSAERLEEIGRRWAAKVEAVGGVPLGRPGGHGRRAGECGRSAPRAAASVRSV